MRVTKGLLRKIINEEMSNLKEGPAEVPSVDSYAAVTTTRDGGLLARNQLMQLGVGDAIRTVYNDIYEVGIEDDKDIKAIIFYGLEKVFEVIY